MNIVKTETESAIHVCGKLQLVIAPTSNIEYLIERKMDEYKHAVLHKKSSLGQKYYSTDEAAAYLGVDPSVLRKRMEKTFIEGIHYFKPADAKIVRWDIEALRKWMTSDETMELPVIDVEAAKEIEELLQRR